MTDVVKTAMAELWRVRLESAVGGSGVNSVDVIIVDLATEAGLSGRGFSYVLGTKGHTALAAAKEILCNFVSGRKMTHPELFARGVRNSFNRTGRGPNSIALASIDTAMWDLYAKSLDCSVGVVMGGEERHVPVYGSGGFNTIQSPTEAAEQALSYVKRGVKAVKPRVSGGRGDEPVIRAVKDAIGTGADLMLDANEKCDSASAMRLLEIASSYGALFVEEPLPAQDLSGYRFLSSRTRSGIALGEHLQGVVEAHPFMADGICAVIQPDLAMMGGLTECLRIARYAEIVGISVAPHFLPNVFVHLAAAAPNLTWLEDFPLLEPLFGDPQTFDADGMLSLGEQPGLGLEWSEEAREKYRLDV